MRLIKFIFFVFLVFALTSCDENAESSKEQKLSKNLQKNIIKKNYDLCLENADIGNFKRDGDFDGIKVEKINIFKAKQYCNEAYKEFPNDIKILRSLARIYHKEEQFKNSLELFRKSSDLSDGYSDWMLSEAYFYGDGVQKDYVQALKYILKSVDKDFIWAIEKIGEYYQYGYGTKINKTQAFSYFKKCAKLEIESCLRKLGWAYGTGELNQNQNKEKELYYINKLVEIESDHGFSRLGSYLLENAKNEIDIRNAILNFEKANVIGQFDLLELHLMINDYPIFAKMFPDEKVNKEKAINILNRLIKNNNHKDFDYVIDTIREYFSDPYYTKFFVSNDFKIVLEELEIIHKNFVSNENQIESIGMSNLAAKTLGDYYSNGFYDEKDLGKSISYYVKAADRKDFDAGISVAWTAFRNKNYKLAFKYNNYVIENSKDPEQILYALNNSAVVDDKINGTGTNFQFDNYTKASKIVDKYGYFVEWPYDNLSHLYYLPKKNNKNENSNLQNIEKVKFYHNKYVKIMEENGYDDVKEWDFLHFLLSKFNDVPKDFDQAIQYLEYAAVNGYTYAYFELAWFLSGYRDKDYTNEIYKWYYICSMVSDETTQNTCKVYMKELESKISYYEKKEIQQAAADYVLVTGDRLAELSKELNLKEPKFENANNFNFGKYHALLIGINEYENLEDLKTPQNDINRIDKVLKQKYKFFTTKLLNPSRRELLKEINKYATTLSSNDNLIIYFAGHGMQKSDEGFWLTKEAQKKDDIDWISVSRIKRKLREIKANNILVIADSCFSGLITRGLNLQNETNQQTPIEILHKAKSRIAITSGSNEPVLDGGGGENSIFAASLASELERRTTSFTASELFLNIQKRVIKETLAFGMKQNPILLDIPKSGHENFDFVFNPK